MLFDLEEAREGEWFKFFGSRIDEKGEVVYDDPEPDAGRVCIRPLAPFFEERQGKRKRRFEFVQNPSTRAMERVGYYDDLTIEQAKKERDDAWDYAITEFEDLLDGKKQPIPCTRENKIRLMTIPVFDRFVARCLRLMGESGAKDKEAAAKN